MIKSIFRYLKFFIYAVFVSEIRNLLFLDFKRYFLGQKVIDNQTICPWSDKTYSEDERMLGQEKAIQWLLHSQATMKDDGIGSYRLVNKWTSSYVETTGYIIPTLLNYGIAKKNNQIIDKAIRAADWLIKVQKPGSGWQGGCIDDNREEVVFNTGQVIRGMHDVYKYTSDFKYLSAAIQACDWLCEIQEPEGFWRKNAFMNAARVYDSYVDAPLLSIYRITENHIYKEKAVRNLNWIIEKKQLANGWFEDCDNTIKRNSKPILHTIAYTIDGLLESGILLEDEKVINAAIKSADMLFEIFNRNKYLRGRYDAKWKGSEYILTTGCAQTAIIWLKLYKHTKNLQYLNAALKMNDLLLFIQDRKIKESANTKGALPGSFPIWGRYESFAFPNWGTKYFADALFLENEFLNQ